jgi:hypothetical protein
MPWARFDERFPWHRKVRRIPDAAFRLHVSAVCWCSEHLTDGFVPAGDLLLVSDVKRPGSAVGALVSAGMWELADDGWQIHDYLDYNPSKAEVEEKREKDAERKRRGRTSESRQSPQRVHADSTRTDDGIPTESARTDPARPEPTPKETQPTVGATKRGTRFPEQWFLNNDLRTWAAETCPAVDVNVETEQWADHHRAKGDTAKDWAASWRTWMRNAQKWARPGPVRQPQVSGNMAAHLALVQQLQAAEHQQGEIA